MKTRRQMFDHAMTIHRQATEAFADVEITERNLRKAVLDAQRKKNEAYEKSGLPRGATSSHWIVSEINTAVRELDRAEKNLADFMNE